MEKLMLAFAKVLDKFIYKNQVSILYHHRVNDTPKHIDPSPCIKLFDAQIRLLKERNYHFVHLTDIIRWVKSEIELPPKSITFTFDDGYDDNYLNVFPVLKKHAAKATIFLISTFLGKTEYFTYNRRFPQWLFKEDYNSNIDMALTFLNEKQILEMYESGLVNFGGHTRTHAPLRDLSLEQLKDEIFGCKKDLEDKLKIPIQTFCYPHGQFNETVKKVVEQAGFIGATTTVKRKSQRGDDVFELSRWIDFNLFVNTPPVIRKIGNVIGAIPLKK